MTAMPQMVAIYNGMGGGAAGAIAAVELFGGKTHGATQLVVTLLGALIGAISFSGSLIAWAKLDGVHQQAVAHARPAGLNAVVILACLSSAATSSYAAQSGADPLDRHAAISSACSSAGAGLRRSDDAADRRRGHAGRHLDL